MAAINLIKIRYESFAPILYGHTLNIDLR